MGIDYNKEAEKAAPEFLNIYKYFHENPELSGEEWNTKKRIMELLTEWGVKCRSCASTGVYAVIQSSSPGHTIAFRADMDALPVSEETGLSYQSKRGGVMHACGHDAHMAMLLGSIKILNEQKKRLKGNLVFLFQPSEERNGGAKRMIEEGVLKNPEPELVVALHVWNQPAHSITVMPGPVMAQPDAFRIEIEGKGGHGAAPSSCKNPIPVLASLVTSISSLVQERIPPREAAVVNVCRISCGENYNLVSDRGFLEGTIRTYHKEVRKEIIKQLKILTESLCVIYGVKGKFTMSSGYPATINDPKAAAWGQRILTKKLDGTHVYNKGEPSMLGEDFSYFGNIVPGLYLRLGCAKEEQFPLHHSKFCIDETILKDGVSAICLLAAGFTEEGYGENEDN